jgi:uncharacterized delta-60 repeat protein
MINKISTLLFSLTLLASTVIAGPGDPDPTFGVNGTATEILTGATVNKVILQPDGKIIVIGKRYMSVGLGQPAKDYLMVRRYTATGALDTIFNTVLKQGAGFDAEVQTDGKVVVLGQAPNTVTSPFGGSISTTSPVVWRFNSDGTVDTGFGSNGARFLNAQSGGNLNLELAGTNILILYASRNPLLLGDYAYRFSRLSPSGDFDYTVTLPYTYYSFSIVTMKVDAPTNDVIVLASQQLRRYNIDGSADTSFGSNGVAAVPYCLSPQGLPISSKDMEIQPDGGILVFAWYQYMQTTAANLTRQSSSGTPDATICMGMILGPGVVGTDLFLQPDGRFFFYNGGVGARFFSDGMQASSIQNFTQDPHAIQTDQKLVTARATSGSLILNRQMMD